MRPDMAEKLTTRPKRKNVFTIYSVFYSVPHKFISNLQDLLNKTGIHINFCELNTFNLFNFIFF